jgi:hypothetical protein
VGEVSSRVLACSGGGAWVPRAVGFLVEPQEPVIAEDETQGLACAC